MDCPSPAMVTIWYEAARAGEIDMTTAFVTVAVKARITSIVYSGDQVPL
jgi:hypothetical protein